MLWRILSVEGIALFLTKIFFWFFSISLFLFFSLFAGLCTRLFASLKTVSVNGLQSDSHSGVVLAVDYSVEAFSETHMPYVYITISCLVIHVIGIPFAVFMALRSNRKYLYPSADDEQKHNDAVDQFGTLYLQYEEKYWYWEVTVIFKKMLLTGAMTIIVPGSSAQLAVAVLIVFTNVLLVLKMAPFVDDTDGTNVVCYCAIVGNCDNLLTSLFY